MTLKIKYYTTPEEEDVDFLTKKIFEESRQKGIEAEAEDFAFLIHGGNDKIVAGCDGSILFKRIYTDTLWVDGSVIILCGTV